jgi:hypothetical protein
MKAWRYSQLRAVYHRFRTRWAAIRRTAFVLAILCDCALAVPARAQQQQPPEDPENEKRPGLWLDQGISASLSANKSLEIEFHESFDEGASNLFEYFGVQSSCALSDLRDTKHASRVLTIVPGVHAGTLRMHDPAVWRRIHG